MSQIKIMLVACEIDIHDLISWSYFAFFPSEVMDIPNSTPLSEDEAWNYFREVILGIEYREYISRRNHYVRDVPCPTTYLTLTRNVGLSPRQRFNPFPELGLLSFRSIHFFLFVEI